MTIISVILKDGGFRDRFHTVDFLHEQTLPDHEYEILWVEYFDSVDEELREREENVDNLEIVRLGEEPVQEAEPHPYHMSKCFNEGIRRASGDIVVIPDSDVVPESTFLDLVQEEHEDCDELALYFRRKNEPEESSRRSVSLEHLREVARMTNHRNYGSCISVRKKWLQKVNGYEEDPIFAGLSANARDLYVRLKNFGLHVRWHPDEFLYHPWHPNTLDDSPRYDLQHQVIERRNRSLETFPVRGLNPDRCQTHDSVREEVPSLGTPDPRSGATHRLSNFLLSKLRI